MRRLILIGILVSFLLLLFPCSFKMTALTDRQLDTKHAGMQPVYSAETLESSDSPVELLYTISFKEGSETAHVTIEINGTLSNSFKIGFYSVTDDIHDYIKKLSVFVGSKEATVDYVGSNIWRVTSFEKPQNVRVEYDIARIIPFTWRGMGTGKEVSVYISDLGGLFLGEYFFLVPLETSVENIKVKFELPEDWKVVCPYIDHGDYYEVPKITGNIVSSFVHRQGIYFGKMRFYSEAKTGNCVVKFGVLEADNSWDTTAHLNTQKQVDTYVQQTVDAIRKFTEIFGENPYPVFSMYTNFAPDGEQTYAYPGTREVVGGYQYWPPARYDELIGHLQYSWFCFTSGREGEAPVFAIDFISKGLGESYLACKIAYELTGDKAYLGKLYQYYLVYKRAVGNDYMEKYEIRDSYYKGAVVGLYLDNIIQNETANSKSIYDVFRYLYNKYKNSGVCIQLKQLQEAVDFVTGKSHTSIFNKYIYGNEDIPVQDLFSQYKESFGSFLKVLESDAFDRRYHGYSIPVFVDIEMAIPLSYHIPFGLLIDNYYEQFAKYCLRNYSVDLLTEKDVEEILSTLTGQDCSGFFKRWKSCYGELDLGEMKEWLKSYLPYSPQNAKATFQNNSVVINWNPVEWRYPSGYYEVTGYTIYRGETPNEGTLIGRVDSSKTIYYDSNIEKGKTYYYWLRTIENLFQEFEVFSDPSDAIVVNTNVYSISSSANIGGSISPSGTVSVNYGDSKTFTITPNEGYKIKDVLVDVKSIGPVSSYTFTNITQDHTIEATFEKEKKETVIILQIGNKNFTVNGETRTLDSPPIIKNNRTLLPIRAVVESLGGTVGWDGTERKVTITLSSTTIELWIGKSVAKVNGIDTPIDPSNSNVVPEIINSRTMLPLRFVTENLGCTVEWDGTTKTITIVYSP